MIKKTLIFTLLFCLSIILSILLFLYSNRDTNKKNGFTRRFTRDKVLLEGLVVLDREDYSIIDADSKLISLYKYRKPYDLLNVAANLKMKYSYNLPFPSDEKKIYGMNTVGFSGTVPFLLNGGTATGYRISPGRKIIISRLDDVPFYQPVIMNLNSFLFISQTRHNGGDRRILKKVNWEGKILKSYLPEKQIDGVFCTDGQYRYDKDSNRIIYMYYLRGEFTCLDTNLNVIYKAKTIDTVRHAKILLKSIKKDVNGTVINAVSYSAPPNIINGRVCIANSKVYIHSYLKADNEEASDFQQSQVIDVYDLENGKYLASFHLPKVEKRRLTGFKIYKNKFIALYKNNLAIYKIPI